MIARVRGIGVALITRICGISPFCANSSLCRTPKRCCSSVITSARFAYVGRERSLSKTVQNELMNIVVIFLGITVGATATAEAFINVQTLSILVLGVLAFALGTAGGLLLAKFMNLFLPEGKKMNPLIGSAGVSAVPMAARVSQTVGQEANPSNFLLMHAMGPNVAGVVGSAVAAGILL